MSHLSQPVQIVLMYNNGPAFDRHFSDLSLLDPRLKQALQEFGGWLSLPGFNSPNCLGISSDTRNITLERFDAQMPLTGFAEVLANPLVVNGKPAMAQAIREHQRAFLIEVGPGSVPGFSSMLAESKLVDILGGVEELGSGYRDNQEGYENRLLLAQAVALAMIREMAPSAVHWVQSQQVFDAASFSNLASDGFSLPLYCGPFVYGGERLPDGSVMAGVRLLGSQHILGKMVTFAPDPQSWSDSVMQMLAFVAYCRSIGRILGDGETMGSEEADAPTVRVAHKNDIPQLPDGYVELSIDSRSESEKPPKMIFRADPDKMEAAMRGARNELHPTPKGSKGWLLGRLFRRRK